MTCELFRAAMTSQQRAHSCPFPHDIATKRPQLGVSLLAPSPNPRPLLHLLGATDQELQKEMARGHPYQFNLGHGRSFKDYKEAANALMERNMPDVLNDRQTTVVFIPDTHLPKEPRVVDVARFVSRKQKLDEMADDIGQDVLEEISMKPGPPKEIQHAKGDLVEKELFQELKQF